jgi:hypothetical protein
MNNVYLDWNIFNKLEKLDSLDESETLVYARILELIENGTISVAYSNAHLNDLLRGYLKNPTFVKGHLNNICRITKNLCIVQYWKRDHALIHTRDVNEFFEESCKEINWMPTTFSGLMEYSIGLMLEDIDDVEIEEADRRLIENNIQIIRNSVAAWEKMPLEKEFSDLFEVDPVFEIIYPRSKERMNYLALFDDVLDLNNKMTKDYSIYKSLKKYINAGRGYFENNPELIKQIDDDVPKRLTFDETLEANLPKNKASQNVLYDQITDKFYRQDLKGHHSDEKFANMIDDGLHTFYAAHFDYFLTIDSKCQYKAAAVYKELGIGTHVLSPKDFLNAFSG